MIRRSLRGRSDYVVTRDTCPTCGGSLEEIAEEWRQTCAARTPAEARGLARFAIAARQIQHAIACCGRAR